MKYNRLCLSFFISIIMCVPMLNTHAQKTDDSKKAPTEKPAEKKTEKPAEKKAEKKAEKPAEKKAEKKTEKPAEKKAEKQAEKPAEKPAEKKAEKKAERKVYRKKRIRPYLSLYGKKYRYSPMIKFGTTGLKFDAPLLARHSTQSFGAVPVGVALPTATEDDYLPTQYEPDTTHDLQLRLAANLLWTPNPLLIFSGHYEQDFFSGIYQGGDEELEGVGLPLQTAQEKNILRKAYGRLSVGPFFTMMGGYMTSHWGLGLLANDGAHGWKPGSAYFGDPRGGDRVLRFLGAIGPLTSHKITLSFAYDQVQDDDITLEGDSAEQMVLALMVGVDPSNKTKKNQKQWGAYAVSRSQTIPFVGGDKTIDINAFDVYWKWYWRVAQNLLLHWQGEGVWITGETTLAPTADFPTHDVEQLALVNRFKLQSKNWGSVIDFIYASGDQNFDDRSQNAFKADPNFEAGMLLFKHVLAAQTARGPVLASDPGLVGIPNEDLDRFPTRSSISNTYTFFPRAWVRPTSGLEIYGGPLLAWGNVPLADPRETRFRGGYPANILGGDQGEYFLGTEWDLGIRFQTLVYKTELMLGIEGAAFVPGAAFSDQSGQVFDTIYGSRFTAQIRF